MATTRINVKKVVLETLLVLSVGLAVLMVRQLGSPRREGFFCDDASIRLPKVPDTISDAVVALTTLLLPSVAMALSEVVRVGRVVPSGLTWRGAAIPLWLVRVYRQTGVFILGSGFTLLTVDVAKNYVGRLRPHFIAVCNPMAPQLTPSMSPGSYTKLCMSSTPGQPEFVPPSAYMCMGSKPSDERDARSSFPSGHAALAFYAAVYLALYVQSRCRRLGGSLCSLVRPIVQWLLLLAAWYITLSRIVDHMHHPTDVLVGGIIGTVFAFFQVFLVSGIFSAEGATDDQLVVLNPTKNYPPSNCV